MEAKDTVFSTVQEAVWDFEKFKLDQAEHSFKAGQESVRQEWNDAMDLGLKEAYKAGIKTVVEWVKSNNELNREPWCEDYILAYGYDPMEQGDVVLLKEDWHNQLKEWEGK